MSVYRTAHVHNAFDVSRGPKKKRQKGKKYQLESTVYITVHIEAGLL